MNAPFRTTQVEPVTIGDIQAAVAGRFGVKIGSLRSTSKVALVVHAREIAMLLAREMTTNDVYEIASWFGDCNATTVRRSLDRADARLNADPVVAAKVEAIRQKVRAGGCTVPARGASLLPSPAEVSVPAAAAVPNPIPPALRSKYFTIQEIVAAHYGVTRADIIGDRRLAKLQMPRRAAMLLARKITGHGSPEIGRRFGGKDHTTVLHAIRKLEAAINADRAVAAEIASLHRRIENRLKEMEAVETDVRPAAAGDGAAQACSFDPVSGQRECA